jgi:hypothetical protein
MDPALLITELRQHMAHLRSVPAAHHASPATFIHSTLEKFTHVFLRQDKTHRALEPPYSSPYQVLSQIDKTLQLLVHRRPVVMSVSRVEPDYILNRTNHGYNSNPPAVATTAIAPPATLSQPSIKTMRSGRHIHFPYRFSI